jgi:ubiquinone/menaquinone biosynthesis C-methylase UbiE
MNKQLQNQHSKKSETIMVRLYRWLLQHLYHDMAWAYDSVSVLVSLGAWDRWRSLALEEMRGQDVLELGFGTGKLLQKCAAAGYSIYGLEPSKEMHAIAWQRNRGVRSFPKIVVGKGQNMPFQDAQFDVVTATFPAPYILEQTALNECRRVLRSRGSDGRPGRLVLVGLWVALRPAWLNYFFPLFYGSSPALEEFVKAQLTENGFSVRVRDVAAGPGQVGVVVAEKIGMTTHASG